MAEIKNVRMALSGIYDYARQEIPTSLGLPLPKQGAPSWVEDKPIYHIYRPAPVLKDACPLFTMLPITHHHPSSLVDDQNFNQLVIGYTGDHPWLEYVDGRDEVGIHSTAVIKSAEGLDAYENGEVQLSPGYIADFKWERGTDPHGEPYDIKMTRIRMVNHLALLPYGRGGADASVLDSAPVDCGGFDYQNGAEGRDLRSHNGKSIIAIARDGASIIDLYNLSGGMEWES